MRETAPVREMHGTDAEEVSNHADVREGGVVDEDSSVSISVTSSIQSLTLRRNRHRSSPFKSAGRVD